MRSLHAAVGLFTSIWPLTGTEKPPPFSSMKRQLLCDLPLVSMMQGRRARSLGWLIGPTRSRNSALTQIFR